MKIFSTVKNTFNNSVIVSLIYKFDLFFKKGIEKSKILNAISKEDNLDERYNKIRGKFKFDFLSCIKDSILSSKIVNMLKWWTENILNIPSWIYGIILALTGIFGLLNTRIFPSGRLSFYLSLLFVCAGFFMFLLRKSPAELLNGSKIFYFVFGTKIRGVNTVSVNIKNVLFWSVLFSASSMIFGIGITLILTVMVLGISFAEKYSHIVVAGVIVLLPFIPTMAMVVLSVCLILLLISKIIFGLEEKTVRNSLDIFVVVFAAVYVLGVVASVDIKSSIKPVLVYECFILSYFAITEFINDIKKLLLCFNFAAAFSVPVSLYGIYQKFTGFDKQNTWVDTDMFEDISGRIVSFFENPNVYGEYIILMIAVCIISFLASKRVVSKLFYAGAAFLNCICLIYTYSRGCWIGVMILVMLFLLFYNRKLFLGFCLMGLASFPFWPQSIINRIASVGNTTDSSTSYRVYIWKGTLRMLKDYWTTGVGVGQAAFNKVYPGYSYSTIIAPHAHNLYLVILSELGILGLFAFLCLMILLMKRMYVVFKNSYSRGLKISSAGLFSGMLGFLIQGMFDNVWYNYRVFLLFWIFVALGACIYNIYLREKNNG